jgi:hypothetical protein
VAALARLDRSRKGIIGVPMFVASVSASWNAATQIYNRTSLVH